MMLGLKSPELVTKLIHTEYSHSRQQNEVHIFGSNYSNQ